MANGPVPQGEEKKEGGRTAQNSRADTWKLGVKWTDPVFLHQEAEPTGPPDRLDTKREGKRRIKACGVSNWVCGRGNLGLGKKEIWGGKLELWLGHVKLDVKSIESGAQD